MGCISDIPLKDRRQRLLDLLPENDWNLVKAGIAAGYSPIYAKTRLPAIIRRDKAFCSRVVDKRNVATVVGSDLRQEAMRTLRDIIADPDTSQRDRISAVSELGRINGWHSETRILETGPRAEQLKMAEIAVARRAALACYDTHLLADGSYAPSAPPMQHGAVIAASNDDDDVVVVDGDTCADDSQGDTTIDADADNDDMQ